MVSRQIHRLPGMRDLTARAYELVSQSFVSFRAYLEQKGYQVIDTPLLEETELFVRKSGGGLTSRLYTFTDPGGHQVSLRPEFTSSVIRHFIQERESLTIPVRWQYGGPVFRYEQADDGGDRQFTQVGAELVGTTGLEGDVEIIGLAWGGLDHIGVTGQQLRVGHLGVLHDLLAGYRLSERARLFIVSNTQDLKSGRTDVAALRERAEDVGLLAGGLDLDAGMEPSEIGTQQGRDFVQGILNESMPAPVGRRTTEQIVDRLLRKLRDADDPATFEAAASLVNELACLDGPPADVLPEARRIVENRGLPAHPVDELDRLFGSLDDRQVSDSQVIVDLGLARGISYYTGVIFELIGFHDGHEVSLGGGGRYDGLVKALGGGQDVPALGFAYNLDQVVNALDHLDPPHSGPLSGP